jgi:transcriptional regulator with GAF, ATPase, and Fis domain
MIGSLIVEVVGAERSSILMLESQSGQLIHRATLGGGKHLPPGGVPTRFHRGEGLAGWVVDHREATIVADIRQDPRWVEPLERGREYRSALAVPLLASDDVQGALLLFHAQPDFFNEDQAERLGSMLKAQQVEAAKSHAILEGVADGVMVADASGQVILFNAAAERIKVGRFGWRASWVREARSHLLFLP